MPMDWIIGGQPMRGQGLADADGVPRRGPRDLAAVVARGMRQAAPRAPPAPMRACAAVQDADRQASKASRKRSARIGGNLYMMDATRMLTAGAVDLGEKPAVLSAIAKYHMTERARAGRQRRDGHPRRQGHLHGPDQLPRRARYMQMPIAITVEGANILTRSLIIFGQGAIRCHPYVLTRDARRQARPTGAEASREFDDALFGHIALHAVATACARFVYGPDRLAFRAACRRRRAGDAALLPAATRFSAALRVPRRRVDAGARRRAEAQGEDLRRASATCCRCCTSCSATLKRYEDEGRAGEDLPLMHWAMRDALYKAQQAHRRRDLQFPESQSSPRSCARRLPARPAVRRAAARLAQPRVRAARCSRRRRRARPADRRHVHAEGRRRSDRRCSSARSSPTIACRADRGEDAQGACKKGKLDAARAGRGPRALAARGSGRHHARTRRAAGSRKRSAAHARDQASTIPAGLRRVARRSLATQALPSDAARAAHERAA